VPCGSSHVTDKKRPIKPRERLSSASKNGGPLAKPRSRKKIDPRFAVGEPAAGQEGRRFDHGKNGKHGRDARGRQGGATWRDVRPCRSRPAFCFRVLPDLPWTILFHDGLGFATTFEDTAKPPRSREVRSKNPKQRLTREAAKGHGLGRLGVQGRGSVFRVILRRVTGWKVLRAAASRNLYA
jgi:hypothetical protein